MKDDVMLRLKASEDNDTTGYHGQTADTRQRRSITDDARSVPQAGILTAKSSTPPTESEVDDNRFEVVRRVENDEWDSRSERRAGLGMSSLFTVTIVFSSMADIFRRHRHHHGRSDDASTTNSLRREEQI